MERYDGITAGLDSSEKNNRRFRSRFFLCMVFCFWFSGYIYVPVFSLYLEDLHFSYGAIGIILGSYGVTQILLRFPLGLLSDILFSLRKQLLIAGFGFSVLSSLLFLMFDSFFFVLAARLFAGITASMWVMATILYAHYFNNGNASKAMGIMQFFTVMPQFASIVFCGLAAAHLGRQVPFWMALAASAAGLVICCFIKDPSAPPANRDIRVNQYIKDTLRLPKLKLFTILSMTAHAVLFMTVFGFTPLYMNQLGMGDVELLWVMSAFFLPHAAATLSFVFLRFTSRIAYSVMLISFAVTGVCLLSFFSCIVHGLHHTRLYRTGARLRFSSAAKPCRRNQFCPFKNVSDGVLSIILCARHLPRAPSCWKNRTACRACGSFLWSRVSGICRLFCDARAKT